MPRRDTSRPDGRVTIREVAARAGVSIATVSHTLNRPEKVSEQTRARVLQVVDELKFTPKQDAVSLARKGVGRIAVVGPFTAYPSYFTRLSGVLDTCRQRQIEVIVFDDLDQPEARSPLLSSLPATGRVDGLILMGLEPSPAVEARLVERGIPTVLVDRPSTAFSSVTVNDEAGGRVVAEHLIALGCRTFAFASPIPPTSAHPTSGELRFRGFQEAASKVQSPDEMPWLKCADDSIAGGRDIARQLLELAVLPDCVFAVHDQVGTGILTGLAASGVDVPGTVRVIGYDDIDLAEAVDLTSVRQPFAESGRLAADVLLARLEDPTAPSLHVSLTPELVVRKSG